MRACYFIALLFIFGESVAGTPEVSDPQTLVNTTIETLRQHVRDEQERIENDQEYAMGLIDRYMSPYMDLSVTSRFVLGAHWRRASTEQREAFVSALKALLLRIFAVHISDYQDAKVSYKPTIYKGEDNQRAVVRSTVSKPGIPPIRVDYRFYKGAGVWKVYDAVIYGVSLVKTYRLTAQYELKTQSLDELIAKMNAMAPVGVEMVQDKHP